MTSSPFDPSNASFLRYFVLSASLIFSGLVAIEGVVRPLPLGEGDAAGVLIPAPFWALALSAVREAPSQAQTLDSATSSRHSVICLLQSRIPFGITWASEWRE